MLFLFFYFMLNKNFSYSTQKCLKQVYMLVNAKTDKHQKYLK